MLEVVGGVVGGGVGGVALCFFSDDELKYALLILIFPKIDNSYTYVKNYILSSHEDQLSVKPQLRSYKYMQ